MSGGSSGLGVALLSETLPSRTIDAARERLAISQPGVQPRRPLDGRGRQLQPERGRVWRMDDLGRDNGARNRVPPESSRLYCRREFVRDDGRRGLAWSRESALPGRALDDLPGLAAEAGTRTCAHPPYA